ncbi:MAG: serine/threonine-protein kinase [Melioribacteraceae bacterium]
MSSLTSEILFEKFQIIEVLKKDEHAAVFLANHIYLSKKIILKVLNTQKLPDPSMVERFKREGKILAKLDHPNIIKVLDFGMSKEFFYISFEYIEGESLRNIFKTKTLSPEQKEHVMIQILKGLDYAHKNQIIHRDIKPENIFIDKNLNVKLGDFGLALSAEDNFVTNPYSIVGTPSYMSPEQVRGAKLTPQSDIFSAGVVFFELFTGKNPFLRDNVSLTLNEIMAYDENEVSKLAEEQPELIKDILSKMLKKNVGQRYESAEEILDELNIHVDQPTIVINNVDREGNKSKLAWIFIVVIFLGIAAIFVVPMLNQQSQNKIISGNDKENVSQNNKSEEPNSLQQQNSQAKDQVDLNKLKEPVVDNKNQESSQKPDANKPLQNANADQNKSIGYGGLFISAEPWVDIYINGEKFDTTPLNKPIKLLEGNYTLSLVNPDYPPYPTQMVKIKADSVTRLNINLNSKMGFLNINSNPWGDVYVNGEKKGQTPLRLLRVAPDFIRILIKKNNYKDIDTAYNVRAGDTLKLNFTLKSK